jgi:hypothetical protein
MGSYGGVLMLGHGRTDNLSPSQATCSHAAETASARFSSLELSLRACVPSQGAQDAVAMRQAATSVCGNSPSRCFKVLPYLIVGKTLMVRQGADETIGSGLEYSAHSRHPSLANFESPGTPVAFFRFHPRSGSVGGKTVRVFSSPGLSTWLSSPDS